MKLSPRLRWLSLFCLGLAATAAAAPQLLQDQPTSLVYPPFWHTPLGVHRGTQDLLTLFTGSRTRFSDPQGLACARLLSSAPGDPEDCRVTVIGVNSGQGNLIYNPSMTQLEVLGDRGPNRGLFRRPAGVALSSDGVAYVADPDARRVLRLRLQAGALQPDGELAPPPGGWREPWGAAFDSQQRLYVSDAGRNQVLLYSADGRLWRSLGPKLADGTVLEQPRSLAVVDAQETWSFYRDNYVYVCDRRGRRLLRLDWPEAKPRAQAQAVAEALPGTATPTSFAWLALDFYENLWVTDAARCQVHKFDRHLRYLASYGGPGTGDGRFQRPTGLAIYRRFGQVFIAEEQAAHYLWIGTDILSPSLRRLGDPDWIEIRFSLTEPSGVVLTAQASDSGPALEVFRQAWMNSGPQTYLGQGPAPLRGRPLLFRFTAEATYSSAQHFAKQVTLTLPGSLSH